MSGKLRKLSKEELLKFRDSGYLTVGYLKKFIEENKIPDDALVVSQRIEDFYFEGVKWGVYTKEGEGSHNMREFNRIIENKEFDNSEEYPRFSDEMKRKFTDEEIENAQEQYHPVWCPVLYSDDKDEILFLDLHY